MWRLPIAPLVLLALLATAVEAKSPAPEAKEPAPEAKEPGPKPIATRQTIFSIPFQIQKATSPAQEPVEVRLYVSTDRAATWRPYGKVPPSRGHFLFRAAGDGEYWFLVRTLDRSGQVRPKAPNRPELRVLVDTTPPRLELDVSRGDAGQIITRWKITEAAPKPESLKISYRTAPGAPWQPIAIPWELAGEKTWVPPADAKNIVIRAEAADTAGNLAVTHDQVKTDDAAAEEPTPPLVASLPAQKWRPVKRQEKDEPPHEGVAEPSPQGPPAVDPVAGKVSPAVQDRYVAPATQAPAPDAATMSQARPRMVNSRVFELEYDLTSAGLSAPARVVLWGTRDKGTTWNIFGQDTDGRSPMLVTVPDEGVYGFRVVVQADPRGPSQPPRRDDLPDVWIGVDLSKPATRIISAQQGTGVDAKQLVIRWEATDQQLATAPVSLFYSTLVGGSWATIASGLENTGEYRWGVDGQAPQRVYLRLEVRDAAGNVAVFETPQAVVIQQGASGARIRGVRPVGQSARRLPKRHVFR